MKKRGENSHWDFDLEVNVVVAVTVTVDPTDALSRQT
jgi:hypothetical protein